MVNMYIVWTLSLVLSHDFVSFFFYLGLFFTNFHDSHDSMGRGRLFFNSSMPHRLYRKLHVSLAITAGSSPLHVATSTDKIFEKNSSFHVK